MSLLMKSPSANIFLVLKSATFPICFRAISLVPNFLSRDSSFRRICSVHFKFFSFTCSNNFLSSVQTDAIIIKFSSPSIPCSQEHQVSFITIQFQLIIAHEVSYNIVLLCNLGEMVSVLQLEKEIVLSSAQQHKFPHCGQSML